MTSNNLNKKKRIYFIKIAKLFFVLALLVFIYSYSPYKLEFSGHYHKIWAHRTNGPERLNAALNYYSGVEVDVIFNEENNLLDVNHPYQTSIGLDFKTLISSIESDKQLDGLWIDIKNLNDENHEVILTKIVNALAIKNINHSIVLIESPNPKFLKQFSDLGFKTSYYLPKELYKKSEKEVETKISEIHNNLQKFPNVAISTSHKDYDIIAQHFPKKEKYIWDLVWTLNPDVCLTRRLLKDETVKVVLVNYKTLYGNR